MAIVLMSINGVGLGHLSRMVEIADYLYDEGERPVLFYQSKKFPFGKKPFHKVQMDSLLNAAPEYLNFIEDKVSTSCRMTHPAIYIEDTYPAKIKFKDDIVQFLIVRPTTLEYIDRIKERHGDRYKAYFIADHPGSPTWPYNETETATLATWKEFHIIGPIFRKPAADGIWKAKEKYNWNEDIPLIVFSMGGGGQHPGVNDVNIFVEKITELAVQIRGMYANARLLFVKGPLYSITAPVPEGFEVIDMEEDMPALFAIAKMAVIRPSFNSTWECINARTPFYYIEGTTYSEPIKEKLQKLEALGLASNSEIFTEGYRQRYEEACRKVTAQWTGKPNETFLEVISQAKADARSRKEYNLSADVRLNGMAFDETRKRYREDAALLSEKRFFIRIDDVVEMTEELNFILSLVSKWKIFSSLEIIPYLCTLTEDELLAFDADCSRLIVSQHGYGHVVNLHNPEELRSEFQFSTKGSKEEVENLHAGKKFLESQFPNRFRGGFTAPFDCFPEWLPEALQDGGWEYMLIKLRKYQPDMKSYKTRVDIWNWEEKRINRLEMLLDRILFQVNRDGYFGLILHPLHFRSQEHRELLALLLAELAGAGYESYNFLQHSIAKQ